MPQSANDLASAIETKMGDSWLPRIYRDRILRMRTRAYEFPALPKRPAPRIHHTLLGIELKVGRRRMLCPDLATARYLAVFARAGCQAVAIPYDITKISQIADELESSWHRMFLLLDDVTRDESLRARTRRRLVNHLREEIESTGAGPRVPEFARSTKQRR
ncbi:MAG TPA: hypothetical protein VGP81_00365 [Pyrinomonadaceae bacterium]|jgi:hypothetical protein|nr:hypothetical protein [Pyrinomonadaceae bacterium]